MRLSKGTLALLIILAVIILDQALKIWVKTHFYLGESLHITDWFQLYFIENNGMAFGMEMGDNWIALISAGAAGNIIDCLFYGLIFNNPYPPEVATMFPVGGGYASLFHGKVVDMLYFPLFSFYWPDWMPFVGGDYFLFFQPVFNLADAAITIGILVLIIFYSKYLSSPHEKEAVSDIPSRD